MSGLLAKLMSAAESSKRHIKGLLNDPVDTLNAWADRNVQAYTKPDVQQMAGDYMGAGVMPAGVLGHIVYHGSPHKFSKFDMSKIGTGEGAQAYGHGLYFAQAKKVADEYAGKLSQKVIEIPGFTPNTPVEHDLIASLSKRANTTQYGSGASAALDDLRSVARTGQGERKEAAQKMLLAMGDFGSPVLTDTGHLYKVDIPDEAIPRMLDWDKPLSQQAHVMEFINKQEAARTQSVLEKRLQTLANVGEDAPNAAVIKKQIAVLQDELANPQGSGLGSMTGGDYYNYLRRRDIPPQEQAEMFSGAGIPGIRYLDGGSRSAGTGTSNFVLFDDQLPRILERNGVPTGLQPWAPGEWRGLLGD